MAYTDWDLVSFGRQWARDDGTGANTLVAINKRVPYLNDPEDPPLYRVSGANYGDPTDHHTLEDAMATADERLPPAA